MGWKDQYLYIPWVKYYQLALQLAHKIKTANPRLSLIVAIARGGLTLSQLLSDALTLPIASFTVQSYKDLKQTHLPHITYGLGGYLHNKRVLLVDDVADTGKTFIRGLAYLKELKAKNEDIITAAIHYKPHSEFVPDYFVDTTSAWIIYPYELIETLGQLTHIWKREKLSHKEIVKRLYAFDFPKHQVDEFTHRIS